MEKKKNEKYDLEHKRPLFFSIGMIISISLALVAFEWKSPIDPIMALSGEDAFIDETIYIPPTTITPPPPPKPKAVVIKVVKDDVPETIDKPPIDSEPIEDPIPFDIPIDEPTVELPDETPRNFAEVMPSYEGGMQNFYKLIAENIRYPSQAAASAGRASGAASRT